MDPHQEAGPFGNVFTADQRLIERRSGTPIARQPDLRCCGDPQDVGYNACEASGAHSGAVRSRCQPYYPVSPFCNPGPQTSCQSDSRAEEPAVRAAMMLPLGYFGANVGNSAPVLDEDDPFALSNSRGCPFVAGSSFC